MRLLTAMFATLLAVASFAQAEDPKLRAEVAAMLSQWDKACIAGDVEKQMAMLTKDFYSTNLEGKVEGRVETRQHLEFIRDNFHVLKMSHRLDQVQSSGKSEAVAWVTMSVEFKNKKTGAVGKFTGRFAESVRRVDGRWLFSSSQALP